MEYLYFDSNASNKPLLCVKKKIINELCSYANPSAQHKLGKFQKNKIDEARKWVSYTVGAKSGDILFFSGASEINKWIIQQINKLSKIQKNKILIVTTKIEHTSLKQSLNEIKYLKNNIIIYYLKNGEESKDLNKRKLNKANILLMIGGHNESGVIANFSYILKYINKKAIVISDVVQNIGRMGKIDKRIDIGILSSHKSGMYSGVGALLLRKNGKILTKNIKNKGQENGVRSGTECSHLIISLGEVSKYMERQRYEYKKISVYRNYIERKIKKKYKNIKIEAKCYFRLVNTLLFSIRKTDMHLFRIYLDALNICFGFGSACSSLTLMKNKSLLYLGIKKIDLDKIIRISLDISTKEKDVLLLLKYLKSIPL